MKSYNPMPVRGSHSQDYWMVAKHVNKKWLTNHVFSRLMPFYSYLLLLLQTTVLWLSIVTFNDAKPPPKWILREFDVSRIRPQLGALPDLETFTWQNLIPAGRVTSSERLGYPPWWVTPPKRVNSSTGSPPPCKQVLKGISLKGHNVIRIKYISLFKNDNITSISQVSGQL